MFVSHLFVDSISLGGPALGIVTKTLAGSGRDQGGWGGGLVVMVKGFGDGWDQGGRGSIEVVGVEVVN